MKYFVYLKIFLIFVNVVLFCSCASVPKEQNTEFVLTQEELEEYFPQVDTSEFGGCTRCGILTQQPSR